MSFCEAIRTETNHYWEASFQHPFVQGIVNGTLSIDHYKFYILQDAYYLHHYTKILALIAAKSEHDDETAYFLNNAILVHESELELHRNTLEQLNIKEQYNEQLVPAPTTYNYVNHMYFAVHQGDVGEAIASLLPCPWLYQEIGQKYKANKPKVELYQQWLDLYSSDKLTANVELHKQFVNRYAKQKPHLQQKLKEHFKRSCYYEYMFWEMSIYHQNWLKGVHCHEFTINSSI